MLTCQLHNNGDFTSFGLFCETHHFFVPELHINAVKCVLFCLWLLSLRVFLRIIMLACMHQQFIPLYCWLTFHLKNTQEFVYSFT